MHDVHSIDDKGLRNFGFLTGSIFAGLFGLLLPLLHAKPFPLWPWVVALLLVVPAVAAPAILRPVYKLWMRVGLVLGWVNTRVILGLFFVVVILPIGVLLRIFKGDSMARAFDPGSDSYRVTSKSFPKEKMEVPF